MTMTEAMHERHTVRKYTDKALPQEIIEKLNARIDENNSRFGLSIKLITDSADGLNLFAKLSAKGVKNYFVLAGNGGDEASEKLGYSSADLMLYAQTLGLNTWYIGGTFNHGVIKYADGKKVIGIVAVGYGENGGVPHKSKSAEQVSHYDGEAPDWFRNGVEAALLAPTAMNCQGFKLIGSGNNVKIEKNSAMFTPADRGIVKYHFELGAGKDNFHWEN